MAKTVRRTLIKNDWFFNETIKFKEFDSYNYIPTIEKYILVDTNYFNNTIFETINILLKKQWFIYSNKFIVVENKYDYETWMFFIYEDQELYWKYKYQYIMQMYIDEKYSDLWELRNKIEKYLTEIENWYNENSRDFSKLNKKKLNKKWYWTLTNNIK